jgi:hypothetical protein
VLGFLTGILLVAASPLIITLYSPHLNPIIDDDLLSLFDPCISQDDNLSLCAIPSEQEIFNALSSIGSLKPRDQMVLQLSSTKNTGM